MKHISIKTIYVAREYSNELGCYVNLGTKNSEWNGKLGIPLMKTVHGEAKITVRIEYEKYNIGTTRGIRFILKDEDYYNRPIERLLSVSSAIVGKSNVIII